ncbi:hypothetical protein BASA83_009742 [Batrachochytrium salamandrivorans]|nr:hypothetical protein BASA83_009742 [Batrachochytrium salamandrivorans]
MAGHPIPSLPVPEVAGQKRFGLEHERTHALDYSDVFPFHIGHDRGVTVFRIESLAPVVQPTDLLGKFCVADCYIVLVTLYIESTENTAEDHKQGHEHGSTRGLVAMRKWTRSSVLPCSRLGFVTGSVLPVASNVKSRVQTTSKSLKSDRVLLLDWGLEIFQWNGSQSNLQHRAKCRIVCNRINTLERVGRAHVVEIEEGDEPSRLWEILGEKHLPDELDSSLETETDTEELRFEELARSPSILYRVFPKIAPQLESHAVSQGHLSRNLLVSDGCYIMDSGVELFLWIGKNAWSQLRSMATELLARVASSRVRPKWVGLNKCIDQHEPEVFKLKFCDWDGHSLQKIDWRNVLLNPAEVLHSPTKSKHAALKKSKIKADVRALYAPPPSIDYNPLLVQDTIEHANRLLQAFTCFVYNRGRFVQLPEGERGHFFTHDAYVFLCVYRVEGRDELADQLAAKRMSTRRGTHPLMTPMSNMSYMTAELSAGSDGAFLSYDPPLGATDSRGMIPESGLREELYSIAKPYAPDEGRKSYHSFGASDDGNGIHTSHNMHTDIYNDASLGPADVDSHTDGVESESGAFRSQLPPVLECVVYFWQGKHASRLAYSTFKLKTQHEMEHLVEQMYHSPVRVVHLEQGKEPIALLAHLDNICVMRAGSRTNWLLWMESQVSQSALRRPTSQATDVGVTGQSDSDLNAQEAQDKLPVDPSTIAAPVAETTMPATTSSLVPLPSSVTSEVSVLFHIRSDTRYGTTRAIQVQCGSSQLVSRDCFFLQSLNNDISPRSFLWVGRGASREDTRRAKIAAEMILSLCDQYEAVMVTSTTSSTVSAIPPHTHEPRLGGYDIIGEKLEPRLFWSLLPGGKRPYASGLPPTSQSSLMQTRLINPALTIPTQLTHPTYLPPSVAYPPHPRLLVCSCSPGYFIVEEIPLFSQGDCQSTCCVILDPGSTSRLFVWIGSEASDVVCKLTRKSVEVWVNHLDDGRIVGFDDPVSPGGADDGDVDDGIVVSGDVVWIHEGNEPIEFRAFFHGWDVSSSAINPGNMFLRQKLGGLVDLPTAPSADTV